MRELLEEARDYFDHFRDVFNRLAQVSSSDACIYMRNKINAALAVPEPDAMEIVRQVREGSVVGHTLSSNYWNLTDSEAAALIASYGCRVPRAMLTEIFNNAVNWAIIGDPEQVDTIADKHGVKIEEAGE